MVDLFMRRSVCFLGFFEYAIFTTDFPDGIEYLRKVCEFV